jgi:hypothetical protein
VEEKRYASSLRERLLASGAELLPWPAVAHRAVVERILGGRRPTRKDAGYRDTLIWETLLEYVVANRPEEVVFVTANVRDFCEGERLHPHLVQDLARAGFPEDFVRIDTSLTVLNKRVFEPTLALLDKARDEIARGEHRGINLQAWLRRHLRDLLDGDHLRGAASDLPDGCGHLYLSSKADVLTLMIEDVRQLSSGELFVEGNAKIGGDVNMSLDGDDYERFPEARGWIGADYSGGSVDVTIREEFSATFELILGDGDVLSSELTALDGNYGRWAVK